jgi:hypothetical protein
MDFIIALMFWKWNNVLCQTQLVGVASAGVDELALSAAIGKKGL